MNNLTDEEIDHLNALNEQFVQEGSAALARAEREAGVDEFHVQSGIDLARIQTRAEFAATLRHLSPEKVSELTELLEQGFAAAAHEETPESEEFLRICLEGE